MKKLLTAIAAAVFIVCPSLSFSSYIIHLKDGREFATDRYYEEGDQIKFKRYGGVIGIRKDLVREIEEIEDVEELPADKETAAPAKEDVSPPAKKQEAEKEGGAEAEGKVKEGKEGASESAEKAVEVEKPKEQGAPEKELDEEKKATKIDVAQYEKEKRALLERYRNARENLEKARKTGDKALRREAKRELKEIDQLISEMALKLKEENGGIIPAWWHDIREKND